MKRGAPLKRSPLRTKPKRQRKPSALKPDVPVRLTGLAMQRLRIDALARSGGFCEMERAGKRCMEPISWESMELAHIKSRGAGGSDTLDNVLASCKWRRDGQPGCHALSHNAGGKPVPQKVLDIDSASS